MGVILDSISKISILFFAALGLHFSWTTEAQAQQQAKQQPPSQAGLATVAEDPNNKSLCSLIGGDQYGKPILDNGVRPIDLQLFAESSPENAQLAAVFQQKARPVKVNAHETRLIGYGSCDDMRTLANSMNKSFYSAAEMQCAGADGHLYRIRPLGNKFKLEIMVMQGQNQARIVVAREDLEITSGNERSGCQYRFTLPHPSQKVENFKMCLRNLEPAKQLAKVQMAFQGQQIPHSMECQTDPGFARDAQAVFNSQQQSVQQGPVRAQAAPAATYAPANQ